jgi:hypothetical protein
MPPDTQNETPQPNDYNTVPEETRAKENSNNLPSGTSSSTLSIIGMILALIGFPFGIVICIIALYKIKKGGASGTVFATIGIIAGILWLLAILYIFLVVRAVSGAGS